MKRSLIGWVVVLVLVVVWLSRRPDPPASPSVSGRPAAVVLRAHEMPAQAEGVRTFMLTYETHESTVRFRFSFTPKPLSTDTSFVLTKGMLEPDSGSSAGLLKALAEMHEGREPEAPRFRVAHISFDVVVFGEQLARQAGSRVIAGEFTNDAVGPWLVTKLFLPPTAVDEEPPEIFLVIDAEGGRAEFLVKDPAYWPALGEGLATVL